ncbi:MAG TPA: hypothetical protein VNY05_45740 [Candidatus Acidoferrales bacterium]|nr:hypothetical protein [Candidatus Acidoferrales bacterium]
MTRNPFFWTALTTYTLILNIIELQVVHIYTPEIVGVMIFPNLLFYVSVKALVYNFLYFPVN